MDPHLRFLSNILDKRAEKHEGYLDRGWSDFDVITDDDFFKENDSIYDYAPAIRTSKPKAKTSSGDYWAAADGTMTKISDLTDSHLINIPKYLYKHNQISDYEEIPDAIKNEIYARGFTILSDFTVVKARPRSL